MMQTLLLDVSAWDLVLDVNGNIALASDPYSLAQDSASSIRTFQGEVYYDTTRGVPYWTQVLGKAPSLAVLKVLFQAAALLVPGVTAAQCFISSFTDREVKGQVQTTSKAGTAVASF